MLSTKINQQGLSLIELMVSMVIGLIVIGGVTNIYLTSFKGNADNLKVAMINQELRSLSHFIDSDIRRAGYWAAVPKTDDLSANPFMASPNDLIVSEKAGEAVNSCITYSYDLDKDKLVGVGASATSSPFDAEPYDTGNMEQFGIRLNGMNIEMRTNLASASESTFDCDSGGWIRITDNNTEITALNFVLTTQYLNVTNGLACSPVTTNCCASGQACQLIRDASFSVTARLANDINVVKTVAGQTRIRNDKYFVVP